MWIRNKISHQIHRLSIDPFAQYSASLLTNISDPIPTLAASHPPRRSRIEYQLGNGSSGKHNDGLISVDNWSCHALLSTMANVGSCGVRGEKFQKLSRRSIEIWGLVRCKELSTSTKYHSSLAKVVVYCMAWWTGMRRRHQWGAVIIAISRMS
jgi:hypothetical protein